MKLIFFKKNVSLYAKLSNCIIIFQTLEEIKKLVCWYKNDDPVLIIAPQKTERLSVLPEVLRFHEILTEYQTQKIIEVAVPKVY